MAGDATNAALWQNADVYIASVGATAPTNVTSSWPYAWTAVGLLDGEAGFAESREEESNEIYAWGGLLVKKTKSKHKRTIKFTALEDNATVFALVNPGSSRETVDGLTTSSVVVPGSAEFAIGFETRDGDTTKRRLVKRAEVESIGEVVESESGLTVYEITVTIYPETNGTLYTELAGSPEAE